jgi:hypothetical protein
MFAADYPFLDLLGTMIVFFGFVLWLWLLIRVFTDLFRRHDISGWKKFAWSILVIVLPLLGVFSYLITQGREMEQRDAAEMQVRQTEFDAYIREAAGNGGPTAEIARAKALLDSGAISETDFEGIKRKALA